MTSKDVLTIASQLEKAIPEHPYTFGRSHALVHTLTSMDAVRHLVRNYAEELDQARHALSELLLMCGQHALGDTYLSAYCNILIRWALYAVSDDALPHEVPVNERLETEAEIYAVIGATVVQCERPARLLAMLTERLGHELAAYRVAAQLVGGSEADLLGQANRVLRREQKVDKGDRAELARLAVMMYYEDFMPSAA